MASKFLLDGETLTSEQLVSLGKGGAQIDLSPEAWEQVAQGRKVVDDIVAKGNVAYGINTGFGLFSGVVIKPEQIAELQENIIRSHAAGVGEPLTREQTRMLLALRANGLAKGHSGISVETLRRMIAAFNKDCLSVVPSKGSLGANELSPLSHLALGMMGEGKMWDPKTGQITNAADVLQQHELQKLNLGAKEGLTLINGTQPMTAMGAEAIVRARRVALCADLACALTLEVLKGTSNAFHPAIHGVRPHKGQRQVAERISNFLLPRSQIFESHKYKHRVQDAYCLRCAPQVHGVVHDTINFVEDVLETEMNSATDNPMVFTGDDKDFLPDQAKSPACLNQMWDFPSPGRSEKDGKDAAADGDAEKVQMQQEIKKLKSQLNSQVKQSKDERSTFYRGPGGFIISGGNFHGEYPAKVLDYLAIGVSELGSISERRIERMVNPLLSDLPAFLVKDGGLNSGFMIAHSTAASCVSENKGLSHPASVDSISTMGSKEDHVSMGGHAARKALEVVKNVETVIAIEILAACQAMEFYRPNKSTPVLEAVHKLVREKVGPWDTDRIMYVDIEAGIELIRSGKLCEVMESYTSMEEPALKKLRLA